MEVWRRERCAIRIQVCACAFMNPGRPPDTLLVIVSDPAMAPWSLQRCWRRFVHRRMQAAVHIQAAWRGMKGRRIAMKAWHENEFQKWIASHRASHHAAMHFRTLLQIECSIAELDAHYDGADIFMVSQNAMATRIQCHVRGWLARLWFFRSQDKQFLAARCIQKIWRGFIGRRIAMDAKNERDRVRCGSCLLLMPVPCCLVARSQRRGS